MLFFDKEKTIRELSVPPEWLYCEDGKTNIHEFYFTRFLNGTDDGVYESELYRQNRPLCDGVEVDDIVNNMVINDLRRFSDFNDEAQEGVPCRIDSNGRISLLDGHHRAAMVVAKGCRPIKCLIKHISPTWQHFCNSLESEWGARNAYSKIEHPWFFDWHFVRDGLREQAILEELSGLDIPNRLWIDIGSHTGYLCRSALRYGWWPIGLESNVTYMKYAEYLNVVFGSGVVYYKSSDFESILSLHDYRVLGVVSCLSVLHHWINLSQDKAVSDERFARAISIIANSARAFVIDIDPRLEKKTDIPMQAESFSAWLVSAMGCLSVKCVGVFDSRPTFIASRYMDM